MRLPSISFEENGTRFVIAVIGGAVLAGLALAFGILFLIER
ncbi:MAG: hypothetical protein QOH98_1224 [Methylobacteriaceae bacterium]|nr:hypothetical protein [Methylobacteriaceae bacterium]